MAATVTKQAYNGQIPTQAQFMDRLKVVFDSSYPTGGESLGLSTVLANRTILAVLADSWPGYTFQYDYTSDKLKAIDTTTGAEVPNTTDLSALNDVAVIVFSE